MCTILVYLHAAISHHIMTTPALLLRNPISNGSNFDLDPAVLLVRQMYRTSYGTNILM